MSRLTAIGAILAGLIFILPAAVAAKPIVMGPRNASTRVVVLHGLDGDPQQMLTAPYAELPLVLARHYQVIVAREPFDNTDNGANQAVGDWRWFHRGPAGHGIGYRLRWLRQFRQLVAWADRTYGPKRLMVAGISWGGMHALLAACYDPQVTAFAVSSPVVNPDSLAEFASSSLNALNPNLNGCTRRLRTIPGFVGWGDADARVGTVAVRRVIAKMPRVRSCRYHLMGHDSNALTAHNMVLALRGLPPEGCYRGGAPVPDIP